MIHKGKLLVFLSSALVALYGISAAFYGRVVATDQAYPALAVFMDALNKINDDYVEAPDMSKVQEGALRGLIDALDPASCFLTKEQAREVDRRTQEGSAGIGISLSKRSDVIYVVSVLEKGPADTAGIRPGDYLVAVDGVNTEYRSVIEVESMVRGAAGSAVKVGLFRSARTQPFDVEVVRGSDGIPSATAQMLEGKTGLLDISSLKNVALEQARIKLKTLISGGAERLILDLRDCADGNPEEGAELSNFFLKDGVIYTGKDREGKVVVEARALPERFITDLPMAVLLNGSTSGAAEIAAGALKDHDRARLVGEKSFGSGASQKRITLKSGALLIISTAKYYTPGGKMIQEENIRSTGIRPDIQWPDSDRRQDLLVESYFDEKEEAVKYRELKARIYREQLEKAQEVVRSLPADRRG